MPPGEADAPRVSTREEDSVNNEPSMSGKSIVGLIFPPPDIRAICEKTAQFVARNGVDFENKIKEKEANNPKFCFLSPTNAYFAFYRAKVTEFESGVSVESAQPKPQLPEAVREHVQQAEFVPTQPPPSYEYMADPATLNAFDLDLMRLTAMFVARNGRGFMTNLMQREHRNHQFDFLKPQHSNFPYFTKLVEQYTKVIIPPRSIVDDLTRSLDYDLTLSDVKYRVAWEKHQRVVKDREDKAAEEERLAYNSIDWHDFVVVQTVDFQPSETLNLPPLCSQKDVGSRILMQQRSDAAKAAAESEAMEMESDSDDDDGARGEHANGESRGEQRAAYEVTQPAPAPPQANSALVRDYDPRKARQTQAKKSVPDSYIISHKLQDHVRYNIVDPQYKEQRDREHSDRVDEDAITNASGTEISRNITRLAERRSDIFGVGAQGGEQTIIGKKLSEDSRGSGGGASSQASRQDARSSGGWDAREAAPAAAPEPQRPAPPAHLQQPMPPPSLRDRSPPRSVPKSASSATAIPLGVPSNSAPVAVRDAAAAPPPSAQPPAPMRMPPQQPPPAMNKPSSMLGGQLLSSAPMPQSAPNYLPPPMPPMPQGPPGGFNDYYNMPGPPQPMPPRDMYGAPMYGGPPNFPEPPPYDAGDEPAQKRLRLEDTLQPEETWIARVNGPIQLRITTPIASEWNLEGQPFQTTLDVTALVSALKADIQEQTTVPSSKQKLCYEGMYLKDTNSLAFYNMREGSHIQLQLKERGGRKK